MMSCVMWRLSKMTYCIPQPPGESEVEHESRSPLVAGAQDGDPFDRVICQIPSRVHLGQQERALPEQRTIHRGAHPPS